MQSRSGNHQSADAGSLLDLSEHDPFLKNGKKPHSPSKLYKTSLKPPSPTKASNSLNKVATKVVGSPQKQTKDEVGFRGSNFSEDPNVISNKIVSDVKIDKLKNSTMSK